MNFMLSNKKYITKKTFIKNGLVGVWDFSNGSSSYIYDQSGYGNNAQSKGGSLGSEVSWGKNSKSISLNGENNYFEIIGEQIPGSLILEKSFAFCAWIKFKSETNGASIAGSLSDSRGWALLTLLKDGDLKLKFQYKSNYYAEAVSEFSLPVGYWVFVSVVYEINNCIKFYLNGNEKKSIFYIDFGVGCGGESKINSIYQSNLFSSSVLLSGSSKVLVDIIATGGSLAGGVVDFGQIHNVDFDNSDYYFYDHLDFYYINDTQDSYEEYSLKLPYLNRKPSFGVVLGG
jgi:hypothetical protein